MVGANLGVGGLETPQGFFAVVLNCSDCCWICLRIVGIGIVFEASILVVVSLWLLNFPNQCT